MSLTEKLIFICICMIFFIPSLKENGGAGEGLVGKRIQIHKYSSFDDQNLRLNPRARTWTLFMGNILQINSTQQNFYADNHIQ